MKKNLKKKIKNINLYKVNLYANEGGTNQKCWGC